MACGRAVAASAVGGMLDVISDGLDGLLLPSRNDDAWVETLHRLLLDPEPRERLGQAARRTILNRFTAARELDATLRVYESVLSR
jgi:glycosyltransferase involved in cell wall biosynthesis